MADNANPFAPSRGRVALRDDFGQLGVRLLKRAGDISFMVSLLDVMVDRIVALQSQAFWSGVMLWIVLSIAVGAVAHGKGRSAGWMLLSLILSPLVGFVTVALLRDRKSEMIADLTRRVAILEGASPEEAAARVAKTMGTAGTAVLAAAIIIIVVGVFFALSTLGATANSTFVDPTPGR